MALALLELQDADDAHLEFRIDCGTNTQRRVQIGSNVERGMVADVYYSTPAGPAAGAQQPFDSTETLQVPRRALHGRRAYAQLVSWKDGGRARAVSEVVDLAGVTPMPASTRLQRSTAPSASSMSIEEDRGTAPLREARSVPHRTALARPASLDALIGEIVKLAAPVVLDLLKQAPAAGTPAAAGSAGAGGAPLQGLMQILQGLLGGLGGLGTGGGPAAASGAGALAKVASLPRRHDEHNRFVTGGPLHVAEPFIFGIDDALIASLIGPLLQVLPQLMNAANAKRIELKKADNQLMAGIVSDVQKRLMLDKVLEAQRAAQAQGPAAPVDAAQLEALAGLLASLPAGPVPAAAGPVAPSVAKSLSADAAASEGTAYVNSERAMVSFEFGPSMRLPGAELPVFQRTRRIVLRPHLAVSGNAPKAPLARAIVRVMLRDAAHPEVRVEKTFKLRDLMANTPIDCAFEPTELAPLPAHARLTLLAQVRWRHPRTQRETRATGAAEIVLVGEHFVRERGGEVDGERELTDMARFRSFWNKVWQAPVQGAARGGDYKLWELDVQARVGTLLEARHDSNALMETRLLAEAPEPDALSAVTRGRMKAGIELSLSELNKLLPLWNGRSALDAATLEALAAPALLADAAREAMCRLRLKGRAGQGGMVWLVPVLRLIGFTVSQVAASDERGQVSSTSDHPIAFPMPVAMRAIGLKSNT
jgi:hypothetical protein